MENIYGLSESDRNTLRSVVKWYRGGGAGKSSRPVPTRRRRRDGGGSASAELLGAWALIVGEVPAAGQPDFSGNLANGKTVVEPGELSAIKTDTTFDEGALMLNPDGTATVVDGKIVVADVVNPSRTPLVAPDGVAVAGVLAVIDDAYKFVISWPDLHGLPGYLSDEEQAPYHGVDSVAFELGHGECEGE